MNKVMARIEVNDRLHNHLYTLVLEDGQRLKMPYMCDCCIKTAIYLTQGQLFCVDHHLDFVSQGVGKVVNST